MISFFPEDIPTYFADAEASFSESDLVLFGVPFDKTASFRSGTRLGPESIRKASWNFESFNFYTNVDLQKHFIHDYGDVIQPNELDLHEMINKVQMFTESILKQNKIPVLLGGEHSVTSAVVQSFPESIMVLSFDAHADFRDSYQNQTYSHACTLRRIVDHVGDDHVYLCGLRSAGRKEYEELVERNISFSDAYSFRSNDTAEIIQRIKSQFNNQPVYVSIDIDVFDPAFAPGTGTLEPFGLHPLDVLSIIDSVSSQIIGFDVMEVNPFFDHGETSFLAAKIIRHIMERLLEK